MTSKDSRILSTLVKRMLNREADPLRPVLDEYLIKRGSSPNRYAEHTMPLVSRHRPGGRLSPSTICGCERQAAFRFLATPGRRRLDPDLELIFEDGNWRHHQWDALFKDMEQVLGSDRVKVNGYELPIRIGSLAVAGHLDMDVTIEGVRRIVDFKGINDVGFTYVYTRDAPKEEHVDQLHPYMKGRKVYEGLLLYQNKNDQRTRAFVIKFDHERWARVEAWCRKVIGYLRRRELPPMHPECDAGNFLWDKCPWSYLCYGSKSRDEIERYAYKNFQGVKDAWLKGLEAEHG